MTNIPDISADLQLLSIIVGLSDARPKSGPVDTDHQGVVVLPFADPTALNPLFDGLRKAGFDG